MIDNASDSQTWAETLLVFIYCIFVLLSATLTLCITLWHISRRVMVKQAVYYWPQWPDVSLLKKIPLSYFEFTYWKGHLCYTDTSSIILSKKSFGFWTKIFTIFLVNNVFHWYIAKLFLLLFFYTIFTIDLHCMEVLENYHKWMIQILSYGFGTLKEILSKLTSHFAQCIHYGHMLNRQLETIPWSKIQDPSNINTKLFQPLINFQ